MSSSSSPAAPRVGGGVRSLGGLVGQTDRQTERIDAVGVIRLTGTAFELAGEIMTADAFEEWAESVGKAQVERFAREQSFSFVLGKGRAKRKLERRYSKTFASETLMTAGR